jgi:hypothetical protein
MGTTFQWVSIVGRNGKTLTHPLVRMEYQKLFIPSDGAEMIPRGTYCLHSDIGEPRYYGEDRDERDIFLNRHDLIGLRTGGEWIGCCGPDGSLPNLVDHDHLPMAYESADCWQARYVRIPFEWHSLKPTELSGEPVILAGTARWRGKYRLIERAVGHDRRTALRMLRKSAGTTMRSRIASKGKRDSIRMILGGMQIHVIALDNLGWFEQWKESWYTDRP